MKLYFVKYYPVEGEIKVGDVYLQNLIGIGFPNEIRIYTGGKLEARDKKVKLFLCSRDIKIGDKVIHNNSLNPIRFGNELIIRDILPSRTYSTTSGGIFINTELLKIIGEISPDATWVKEGDEFDEDEIGWLKWDIRFPEDGKTFYELSNEPQISNKHYVFKTLCIKGPCGHFH